MISDEKSTHIVNLMIDALDKGSFVKFKDRGAAVQEAKKTCLNYMKSLNEAATAARQRIESQKNAPPEFSPQWDNLYQKYYEEELNKRGG